MSSLRADFWPCQGVPPAPAHAGLFWGPRVPGPYGPPAAFASVSFLFWPPGKFGGFSSLVPPFLLLLPAGGEESGQEDKDKRFASWELGLQDHSPWPPTGPLPATLCLELCPAGAAGWVSSVSSASHRVQNDQASCLTALETFDFYNRPSRDGPESSSARGRPEPHKELRV